MPINTIERTGFSIVAIEAIWPNNIGDEASLDYLDLSYLSQKDVNVDTSVYLGSMISSEYITGDKDAFITNMYLYLYNPGVNRFPSGYQFPNSAEMQDYNPIEAFNNVKQNLDNGFSMGEDSSITIPQGDNPSVLLPATTEEKQVVPIVTHLFYPLNLKSADYYTNAIELISNFDKEKSEMNDGSYPGGVRPVFLKRAQDLLEAAKKKEQEENKPFSSKTSNGLYPRSVSRPDFNGLLKNSADAYKKRRGYFKIVPLNITQVNTSSSIAGDGEGFGGSNFSITFTMDDLLIVADPYAAQQIDKYVSNAIPVNQNNQFYDIFNNLNRDDFSDLYDEVLSSEFSAFRVSGVNFPFNIEDAVEGNDTVTVWMYHDPKEFSFVKDVESSSLRNMTESFVNRKDFSYIVGNLSRKSQDDISIEGQIINASQSILLNSEVLNDYITPSASGRLVEEEEASVEEIQLSASQVFSIIKSSGEFLGLNVFNEGLRLNPRTSPDFIEKSENDILSVADSLIPIGDSLSRNIFVRSVKSIFIPEAFLPDDVIESKIDPTQYILPLTQAVQGILDTSFSAEDAERAWRDSYANRTIETVLENPPTYGLFVSEGFFNQIYGLINPLSATSNNEIKKINERNKVKTNLSEPSLEKVGFFNKRTMLSTSAHGETPYLALKGHISSITSSYGPSSGSHTVTIKGSGYEKLLKDNQVYYEDLFYPSGGQLLSLTEVFTFYLNMLPPTAIVHFIATHLPKFIMIGFPTYTFNDMKNMAVQALTYQASLLDESPEISIGIQDSVTLAENSKEIQVDIFSDENINNIAGEDTSIASRLSEFYNQDKKIIRGQTVIDANDINGSEEGGQTFNLRVFYPVNYLNTSRMKEMINILIKAYEENPSRANILSPISIKSNSSIENNLSSFNGPQIINQLFTDETGRLRQRTSFEAWERTPNPQYSPTITDEDVIKANFTKDSASVLNMVDIRPYFGGQTLADAQFAGRALADGNDYIPFISINEGEDDNQSLPENETSDFLTENFYEVISEPFFRYGKKYKRIERDIYAKDTVAAKRKAIMVQRFYGKPLKNAEITIANDTSYRVGETVLVNLSHSKHRSREIIDVQKTLDWLNVLEGNKDLREIYIGADTRFLNYESYYKTITLSEDYRYSYWLKDFVTDPHMFILKSIKKTFEYLKLKKAVYITPEFFPNTYWAFDPDNSQNSIANKFNPNLDDNTVKIFYDLIFRNLSGVYNSRVSDMLKDYPELINLLRMQNFRSTSYYIKGVNHTYTHGSEFSTRLSLTHGQDNVTIIEPFSMKPIGFMSIEKKMRIGYDDKVVNYETGSDVYDNKLKGTKDRLMWEEFGKKMSPTQRMYVEQFKEDKKFKDLSFLYNSQKYRTSSNFMYKIAMELGL